MGARRTLAAGVGAVVLAAAVTACGSSADPAPSAAGSSSTTAPAPATSAPATTATTATTSTTVPDLPGQVLIRDYELLPPTITIPAGATVTWQNADDVDHWMLTEDGTTVDSGAIAGGQSYVATLSTPGTYPYYCDIHNSMTGTIVVE